MALTPEDKADVKGAMGKAIANKISKVTRDKPKRAKFTQKSVPFGTGSVEFYKTGEQKYKKGYEPLGHKFGK